MSKPVEIEFLMKDRLTPGVDKVKKHVDGMVTDLRNSISLLENQLEELRLAGENAAPDFDQTRNIAQIEALQNKIEELQTQLKQLESVSENTRVVPPELPQAKKQFNGLHMSIQQMAREMPSLAMGPQMFFLAISNNLPIFTDELKRARDEYDALIKTGQKGTPVWKQILSSLFSWQTALTTGIMLLVMYGDEIIDWTKDLFSAKKGVDEFNISLEEMVELEKDGRAQMVKTRFEIDSVIASINDFNGTRDEEKSKVDELNRKYGESFGYYSTIAEWYDTLTDKSEVYVQSLLYQAQVQGLVKKATEIDSKIAEAKAKDDSEFNTNWGYGGRVDRFFSSDKRYKQNNNGRWLKQEEIARLQAEYDAVIEMAQGIEEKRAQLLKDAGLGGHTKPDTTNTDPEREATNRLAAEKELSERMLELQRQNQQDSINLEKEGLQKKLAQIELDYQTRKAEIERNAKELAALNKDAGGDGTLTANQQTEIDEANRLNLSDRQKAIATAYQAEFDAMKEHLKEYGTFQQQKLAIAQEYAEKIRNASTEGEKLTLGVERDSALAHIEAQELKANIDWSTVFGEFGGMFSDLIKPALEDARQYMQTDEFKNADQASQDALVEAVRQMQTALGGADKVSFRKLGTEISEYQQALAELKAAQAQYAEVYQVLVKAQSAYVKAMQEGTEEEQAAAKAALETAQTNADAAATNIQTLQETADAAQQSVSKTASGLRASMDNVMNGLSKIASGSISGAYDGLITLGKGAKDIGGKLGDAFGKVSETLEDVPIVGWIVQIVDLFKDGISVVIGGLLDAVFNAVSGIIGDVLSGDLFVTIGKSVLQGVGNIFDALTFGGFSSWFGSGDSDKTLHQDIEYLTVSNENLRQSIDNLAEKMEDTAVSEASQVYERQKELLEQQIANTQEMMRRSGAAYSNGFLGIGGSHSSNHKINEAMSSADWKRISDIVGRRIGSASDFWGLSSEEMARVADEATDLYSKIEALADDGHENAAQYMDEYIGYYKELEQLQEAYYEKLTGVSFDSVRGKFKNMLLDLKSDASTASEDIGETMLEGIVEGLMSEEYNERLRKWYEGFAKSMEDGTMSDEEIAALRAQYQNIVSDALSDRDALIKALGLEDPDDTGGGGTSQSGKSGAFTSMTQEQGTKLEGLFTSGQMHWASIDSRMENVADKMDIASDHLRRIEENTRESKEYLAVIRDDIKKVMRDGLKMK